MKTIDEVKQYLRTTGFTGIARAKIMGFVIGCGLKENEEEWCVRVGTGTWNEFYNWFITDDTDALQQLISEVIEKRDNATSTNERTIRETQLGLLLSLLEEYTEDE